MTTNCPLCNSEIPDDHPAMLLTLLNETVKRHGGFAWLEDDQVGQTFRVGIYSARIEDIKTTPEYPANTYDGAYDQGTEFEAHIVISINGHYFKKTGTGDSYGAISWDGELLPAKMTEKVLKIWE